MAASDYVPTYPNLLLASEGVSTDAVPSAPTRRPTSASDSRQTWVTRLYLFPAHSFQVIEEGEDSVAIEMVDGEIAWPAPCPRCREQNQHAKGIAIAGDRCLGGITLLGHAMAEEGLQ